jgi:cell division protein ZapE
MSADSSSSSRLSPLSPRERYHLNLQQPGFVADDAQRQAVEALQAVYEQLMAKPPRKRFGRSQLIWPEVSGLYLWGGVGRGKTHLMDLFYDALPFSRKQRTHFHRFMLDVHHRLKALNHERDPLMRIAEDIAGETRVLCFDEFFVSDIADAMILGRLFEALFARGITLVATSNVVPDSLYKGGLQRERFLPAIDQLKKHAAVLNVDAGVDYRLRTLHGADLYLYPDDAGTSARLESYFEQLAPHGSQGSVDILINDRPIRALRAADGAAWFTFNELCESARSAADYIELARTCHTLILTGLRRLGTQDEDAARRFITLIDELYDRGVKLLVGAAVPVQEIYAGKRLVFEFERTRSRLTEMQSEEYLAKPHLC